MRKRYVLKNKFRFAAFLTVIMATAVSLLFVNTVYGYRETIYKSVTIESGDTLWSLAEKYSDGSNDIREYVNKVKVANKLSSSIIYEGTQIKVPIE